MEVTRNASEETVEAADGVHLTQLSVGEEMSVQHFEIEPGARVPEHDHPHEQAGYVSTGSLTFVVDGEEYTVNGGDSYSIPGGEPHAAENRGETTVTGIDVFSPPRENPAWQE